MAYKTVTEHSKVYPFTSVMASPYSCDNTGTNDCSTALEGLKAHQSNVGEVFFPQGTYSIATNLTIPSGMFLRGPKATLSIAAGVTLTIACPCGDDCPSFAIANTGALVINGSFKPGLRKVFADSNTGIDGVTFGVGAVTEIYPEWWVTNTTPGTTDMTNALQPALTLGAGGIPVELQETTYLVSGLTYYGGQVIRGRGSTKTIIKNSATTGFVLSRGTPDAAIMDVVFEGFKIDMDNKGYVGLAIESVWYGTFNDIYVDDLPASGTFSYDDGSSLGSNTYKKCGVLVKGTYGVSGCYYNKFDNLTIYGEVGSYAAAGIVFTSSSDSSAQKANTNVINRARISYCTYGAYIPNASQVVIKKLDGSWCDYPVYTNSNKTHIDGLYAEYCKVPVWLGPIADYCDLDRINSNAGADYREISITGRTGDFEIGETLTFTGSGATGTLINIQFTGNFITPHEEVLMVEVTSNPAAPTAADTVEGDDSSGTATVRLSNVASVLIEQNHKFTVSGVSEIPVYGSIYTHNDATYIVMTATATLIEARRQWGAVPSGFTGTLTKMSGTGDATISFSDYELADKHCKLRDAFHSLTEYRGYITNCKGIDLGYDAAYQVPGPRIANVARYTGSPTVITTRADAGQNTAQVDRVTIGNAAATVDLTLSACNLDIGANLFKADVSGNGPVGLFTLDNAPGDVATVVSNTLVTANTRILFAPATANAAAAMGSATGVYHDNSSNVAGTSFTIKHAAEPGTTCTFFYLLIN